MSEKSPTHSPRSIQALEWEDASAWDQLRIHRTLVQRLPQSRSTELLGGPAAPGASRRGRPPKAAQARESEQIGLAF